MMSELSKDVRTDRIRGFIECLGTPPKPTVTKINESFPFVDLLGKGWKISRSRDGRAYCDHPAKILHVPVDNSIASTRTRFHELGHVKWTPPTSSISEISETFDTPVTFVQAAEDARINNKLVLVDEMIAEVMDQGVVPIDTARACDEIERIVGTPDHRDLAEVLAAMYVCCEGYGEQEDIRYLAELAQVPVDQIDGDVLEPLRAPHATIETTAIAAQRLREIMRPPAEESEEEDQEGESNPDGEPMEADGDIPFEGDDESDRDEPEEEREPMEMKDEDKMGGLNPNDSKPDEYDIVKKPKKKKPSKKDEKERKGGTTAGYTFETADTSAALKDRPAQWDSRHSYVPGIMQVLRPRLEEKITSRMDRPRVPRQDLAGGEVRSIHRIITDEKILRRKSPMRSRKKVGTMIIDVSGSMSIRTEDIDRVLKVAPQVTVALYSSNLELDGPLWAAQSKGHYSVGHLSIVAHKGRRISTDDMKKHVGGGNVVDEEALRWVARQPGPRVWICDGIVTGMRDNGYEQGKPICNALAKRANVTRYESIYDFLETLKGVV